MNNEVDRRLSTHARRQVAILDREAERLERHGMKQDARRLRVASATIARLQRSRLQLMARCARGD